MNPRKELRKKEHKHRRDLAGEHVWGDAGQIILFLVFLAVWITDSFMVKGSTFPAASVPLYLRAVPGLFLLGVSGYLAGITTGIVFRQERREAGVIRTGIYNRVRHPMYLSVLLLYLGLLIFTCSLWASTVWLAGTAFYHYIARYEEKLLKERFGDDYEKYMKDVPMWMPRWGTAMNS
ncbi:methyltransferase family protein [Fibrobacterota bacterium]